jgi:hypothetical protein
MLGPDQGQRLVLQVGDVAPDLGSLELPVAAGEVVLDFVRDALVGQDPLLGGLGCVVPLGHRRAAAVLGEELLLGEKKLVCSLSRA